MGERPNATNLVRVVRVLPVEVSQKGFETPLRWEGRAIVTAKVPLSNHVGFVPSFIHVLGQHLSAGTKYGI